MITNLQSVSLIAAELPPQQRNEINTHHVWHWKGPRRRQEVKGGKKSVKKSRFPTRHFIGGRNSVGIKEAEVLHDLWQQYAKDFFEKHNISQVDANIRLDLKDILPKMELIGAKITVTKAKCHSIVEKCGIIIMDSRNMFTVVKMEGGVIHLPKNDLAFELNVGDMTLVFFGKFLTMRIADRCVRTYKNVQSHEL
ncbi:hypothetical protein DMENIID0001_127960 [Sergentomyia squamirostris]